MMDLATLDQACAWLGIDPASAEAPMISGLITSQSAVIQNYINRDLTLQTYVETLDGNGRNFMPLQNWPVVQMESVVYNKQTIPGWSPGVEQLSWRLRGNAPDPQTVALYLGTFWKGFGNVVLTYQAGYTINSLPADINQACLEMVGIRYREKQRIGELTRTNKTTGETVSFFKGDLTPSVQNALRSYRRVWSWGASR